MASERLFCRSAAANMTAQGKRRRSAAAAAPAYSRPPPKRSKNAYLVYLAKHEPVIHAQHPDMTRNQVMNIVASMWKEVSYEERVRVCILQTRLDFLRSCSCS